VARLIDEIIHELSTRKLAGPGLEVSAISFGCVGMSRYGAARDVGNQR
jgi:hypothetical protein